MKELKEKEILKIKLEYENDCFDESHNFENCLNKDTKLVIIGTITPKNFDYFYCAPRNKIFGYIDEAIGTNLKELKLQLNSVNNINEKISIKNEIIKILTKNKIAFIDVMKYVLRNPDKINSHDDSAIDYYCVDENAIKQLHDKQNNIICNSKISQKVVEKYLNVDITYLPQRGKGSKKSIWLNEIKSKFIQATATKILTEHKKAFRELAK